MADKTEDGTENQVNALTRILDILVPAKTVLVTDAAGEDHKLPGALPAERQIEVLRKLEALKNAAMDDPAVQTLVTAFKKSASDDDEDSVDEAQAMGSVIDVIVKLAGDPDVLTSISDAFGLAHPGALKRAQANMTALEGEEAPLRASALFPLEELLAGLIPFFVRLLKRGGEALGVFTQATATTRT